MNWRPFTKIWSISIILVALGFSFPAVALEQCDLTKASNSWKNITVSGPSGSFNFGRQGRAGISSFIDLVVADIVQSKKDDKGVPQELIYTLHVDECMVLKIALGAPDMAQFLQIKAESPTLTEAGNGRLVHRHRVERKIDSEISKARAEFSKKYTEQGFTPSDSRNVDLYGPDKPDGTYDAISLAVESEMPMVTFPALGELPCEPDKLFPSQQTIKIEFRINLEVRKYVMKGALVVSETSIETQKFIFPITINATIQEAFCMGYCCSDIFSRILGGMSWSALRTLNSCSESLLGEELSMVKFKTGKNFQRSNASVVTPDGNSKCSFETFPDKPPAIEKKNINQ